MRVLVQENALKTDGYIPVKVIDVVKYYVKLYNIQTPLFKKDDT